MPKEPAEQIEVGAVDELMGPSIVALRKKRSWPSGKPRYRLMYPYLGSLMWVSIEYVETRQACQFASMDLKSRESFTFTARPRCMLFEIITAYQYSRTFSQDSEA